MAVYCGLEVLRCLACLVWTPPGASQSDPTSQVHTEVRCGALIRRSIHSWRL